MHTCWRVLATCRDANESHTLRESGRVSELEQSNVILQARGGEVGVCVVGVDVKPQDL